MRPFYVTTPIYYVNDVPHLGHAYTTVVADALKRHHALAGRDARLLTGTDEHGLKIERVAQEHGKTPKAFVDEASAPFKAAWPQLDVFPDDFIRTTNPAHITFVQDLWKKVFDRGYLYEGTYEDWYCVGCESYKTEKELLPGNLCAVHQKPVERLKEETYFFKLSEFEKPLLAHYEKFPGFIKPESRRNEVLSFVSGGLRDLSVSRTSFSWGIPVPGNPKHIMYVWFDALANYLSALAGNDAKGESLQRYWTPGADVIHIVGKDILRFHAVYWPAFLLAAGYTEKELPTSIVAHGFLTIDGMKMSKSLRNSVDPLRLARELGPDVLRYYLLRHVSFGQDGDFDHAALFERYNADLGKNLGNLLSRTMGLCVKLNEGRVPSAGARTDIENDLWTRVADAETEVLRAWNTIEPHRAIEAIWTISSAANQYVDRAAPWAVAKTGDAARVATILRTLLDVLERLSIWISPAMPVKSDTMRAQLGLAPARPMLNVDVYHAPTQFVDGAVLPPNQALFPTYDEDQTRTMLQKLKPMSEEAPKATALSEGKLVPASAVPSTEISPQNTITYDHFSLVDLRAGLIQKAERVPKKDKLLQLEVDLGEPVPRQIVAGLALSFKPEDLVGKRVVVVANLAPRDFGKGLVSHGMILASGPSEALHLATVDDGVPAGSKLK